MDECDSQAFLWIEYALKAAYRNFYNKKAKFPKFKKYGMEERYASSHRSVIRLNEAEQCINLLKLGKVRFRSKPRGQPAKSNAQLYHGIQPGITFAHCCLT